MRARGIVEILVPATRTADNRIIGLCDHVHEILRRLQVVGIARHFVVLKQALEAAHHLVRLRFFKLIGIQLSCECLLYEVFPCA